MRPAQLPPAANRDYDCGHARASAFAIHVLALKNNGRLPVIIQGGMGVGISDWRLAQAVSSTGQLGVVSGTALDTILVRRLQSGDPGGHMRRALARLPFREMAARIVSRYFISGGKSATRPYLPMPMH